MNENISESLIIMAVGMITVFAILGLVVLTGQVLIRLTNRFAPAISEREKKKNTLLQSSTKKISTTTLEKKKVAAIIGTVEAITQGRGRIQKIEKL